MSVWFKAIRFRRCLWQGMVMVLAIASCAPYNLGYLDEVVNRATQEEIAKAFGPPPKVTKLAHGGAMWTYYDRGSAVVGYGGYARTTYCREFLLTFDENKILRAWKEETCRN